MTTDRPATEPRTEAGRDTLADVYFAAAPGSPFYDRLRERILAIEAEAAQRTAPLDPLLPDSAVAEMLRKVIRQYHGNGHREGSWTHCDNRWCRDAQAVLEGAAPRAEGLLPRCPECGFMGRKGVWHAEGCPQAAPRAEGPSRWDVREAYERGYAEGQRALTDEEDEPMDHHEVNALAYRAGKAIGGALSAGRKEQLHTIEGAAPRAEAAQHDDSCMCHIGRCIDCGCTHEYAARSAEALQLTIAGVFQDHRQQGANACECGWRPNIGEPSWGYHQHLMLKVLECLGVRDE